LESYALYGKVIEAIMTRFSILLSLTLFSFGTYAQVNFTGDWAPTYHEDAADRIPGPELGDYMGLPLNDAGRLRADSWDANQISLLEYQCRPHSSDYGMRALGNMRITHEINPANQQLIALKTYMPAWGSERTIWLDGRPHPPAYAEHTFQGFSTGFWNGNRLTITTTHQKANYLRRNGVPSSDKRIVTEHWMRHHDVLTVVTVVDDPVFLTEPLVRSQSWFLDPGQFLIASYCEYVPELPSLGENSIPHHLPGENPYVYEIAEWYGLPGEVLRGGAETMYPEYQLVMPAAEFPQPQVCVEACNCVSFGTC